MKIHLAYDEYEKHAIEAPPSRPLSDQEKAQLLSLVRLVLDKRAALKRMRGGQQANVIKKELAELERVIMESVSERGYMSINWPEQRVAILFKSDLWERVQDWDLSTVRLLTFS